MILLLFAVVVGGLHRRSSLHANFDDDLRATRRRPPGADHARPRPTRATASARACATSDRGPPAAAGGAVIRVVDRAGRGWSSPAGAPDLGPPRRGRRATCGGYRVVSRPLFTRAALDADARSSSCPRSGPDAVAFVQYAQAERQRRPHDRARRAVPRARRARRHGARASWPGSPWPGARCGRSRT